MKVYIKNGYQCFYDRYQKLWIVYPVDSVGNRIEWDIDNNPIEVKYFNNKTEMDIFLDNPMNINKYLQIA